MRFTAEQLSAIERRDGDLLLDAGAGSGKTSVLVERFTRAVREDGVDVGRILAITFTDKAAAELRERIRSRLRELGCEAEARDTEGAYISTIHGFCARVLRTHALAAGLDPSFTVLEAQDAEQLAAAAFDAALADAALSGSGAELIASHGPGVLRAAILGVHDELRSRGQIRPELPVVAAADGGALTSARAAAVAAARAVAAELGALPEPGVRVTQALDALARAEAVIGAEELWPGDLYAIGLPARNGATALKSDACEEYRTALDVLRTAVVAGFAVASRDALNALLVAFAERYAALKRARSAVDFEDLELMARELLSRPEIGGRYRERFLHVMVDELQDTNRVQLELVDLLGGAGVQFMVGDAQQSIYGFRHADVELFEQRGREMEERGARASLQTNFRSRPEILTALNAAFANVWGERFRPLVPGREPDSSLAPASSEPLTELIIIDKAADWETEGLAAPWRLAEARALAGRVAELIQSGQRTAGEVVVLTRATTDLQAYERALEDAGVPTYVIGGRGYWNHPQVVQMVSYLRALANPLDEEALYACLVSPLCGLSLDGLVLVAAGARDELSAEDGERLERFEAWFAVERVAAARHGVEALIERAMDASGYDAAVLGMPGGRRRMANVRKLMRLGRGWEARSGLDLRGFLTFVEQRAWGVGAGATGAGGGASGAGRESEAPVESEGLDAVRLMTIHRAKGLEFPVVCVADLGRGPTYRAELIRIGRDAGAPGDRSQGEVGQGPRLGLRLGRPGTAARVPALDYDDLGREQVAADEAEERRLFYVAMTRAQERLILSGAAKMDTWEKGNRGTPIDWIAPAFAPDIAQRVGEPSFTTDLGVSVRFVSEDDSGGLFHLSGGKVPQSAPLPGTSAPQIPTGTTETLSSPQISSLSYSSLALYERCGYRFYAERLLGLPQERVRGEGATQGSLSATDRGTLAHAILQGLSLSRPMVSDDLPAEVRPLIEAFAASDVRARLAAASGVRREQRFAFPLGPVLVTGTFDVLAVEADGHSLVVDYKTDRLGGEPPAAVADREYSTQRLVYALAALRAGARQVEVVHLFLQDAANPVSRSFGSDDQAGLEAELTRRAAPLLAGRFEVTPEPHRSLCAGCPAVTGLCSWPLEMTMRSAADRLF
jgi:ATP-dependent exoDNAse (exonuclease V) beta subunit